jgi:hypothetical protein
VRKLWHLRLPLQSQAALRGIRGSPLANSTTTATTQISGVCLIKLASILMNEELYYEDDFRPNSPGLERVYPKATPPPSPPPVVTKLFHPPVSSPSSSSSRRQKKANRRKTRPTQGDWVLIREMAPNQPEIAQQVSQQALNSDSDTGNEDEDDMEDQLSTTATTTSIPDATPLVRTGAQPFHMQQPDKDGFSVPGQPTATSNHRDSVVEADPRAQFLSSRRASEVSHGSSLSNGARQNSGDTKPMSGITYAINSPSPANSTSQRRDSTVPHPHDELTTGLHQLQIPENDNRLPIIQPQTPQDAPSPATQQSLPPISHITGDIAARSASISEDLRSNGGLAHRQSISSLTQSPTSRVRQMSISSHTHTPVSPFPLSASSPISANSDLQRGDIFLRSGSGHVFDNRRPSQASEDRRYSTIHCASTSEGYQSSDGPSPGIGQSPIENRQRHMSLDGTLSATIILPPPNGSGMQQLGQHSMGAFRCDYPGCNALPFQTQYLLK